MSQTQLAPGEQNVIGPLDVFIASAGTPEAVLDVPGANCGDQTVLYGTAADDAGIATALAAATVKPAVNSGFGNGTSLAISFTQPSANTAWVAWIAVSEEPTAVPTGFTKETNTIAKDGVDYTIYKDDGQATDTELSTTLLLGGDSFWRPLGYQAACSITSGGVTITHTQGTNAIYCLGRPAPSKYVRTTDEYKVGFELQDMTAQTYAEILESTLRVGEATDQIQVAGFSMTRQTVMRRYALLVRGTGLSPYLPGQGNIQWWTPYVVQTGNPAPVFTRESPAALSVEFSAIDDTRAAGHGFGEYKEQRTLRA